MNKKVLGKKFSRDTTSRRAMYRALIRSFVENRKLVTTYSKARVIMPMIEKVVRKAKAGGVSGKRYVYSYMGNDRSTAEKIFEISKFAPSKGGGLLKYINLPSRKGDNAPMARVEFSQKPAESLVSGTDKTPDGKSKTAKGKSKEGSSEKPVEPQNKKKSVSSVIKELSRKLPAKK